MHILRYILAPLRCASNTFPGGAGILPVHSVTSFGLYWDIPLRGPAGRSEVSLRSLWGGVSY